MVLVSSTLCWTVWEVEEEDLEIFMLAFQFAIYENRKKVKINKFKFNLQTTHMLRNSYKDFSFKNCEKCVAKQ